MKWPWSKKTYKEKIEDTTPPTNEEMDKFKDNVKIIIKVQLEALLLSGKFHMVDNFLLEVPTRGKTPTYVLEFLLDIADPFRDELGAWTAFVNRVEDNAIQRDEFTEGQFDKYRKD